MAKKQNQKTPAKKVTVGRRSNAKSSSNGGFFSSTKVRLIIFALLFGIGGFLVIRSYASTVTGIHIAPNATNLTTNTAGPRIVKDSSSSKRNADLVYVKAGTSPNQVTVRKTLKAGSHKVCVIGKPMVAGSAGSIRVSDKPYGTAGTVEVSEKFVNSNDYWKLACPTIKLTADTNLYLSAVASAGAYNFSIYAIEPVKEAGASTWPSASNTGVPAGTSLRTFSGTQYVEGSSWFTSNGFSGSGTASSPWLIDRALITGQLNINVGKDKHVLVKRSRIYGNSIYGVEIKSGVVTIEDSTIGPNVSPGDSSQKNAKGIRAYSPTTVRRSNIFNNEVQVSLEGGGPWLVEGNYLHHTWFKAGAHTGVININYYGSNGVIRGNMVDGIRNDGGYSHNGVSIYNDGQASKNWTIENNYFDRNQFHIYTAVTPPLVVKNNVLTTRFQTADKWYFYGAISGWTDGGGNVDENGRALPIKNR